MGKGGSLNVIPLPWGDLKARRALLEQGEIDFIFCSDCVFDPVYGKSWVQLIDCMDELCGEETQVYFSLQRRRDDGIDAFIEAIRKVLYTEELNPRSIKNSRIKLYRGRRFSRKEMRHKALDEDTG